MQKRKILLVDDDELLGSMISESIKFDFPDVEILTALDPETGIQLALNNADICLIITDYNMPNKTGVEMIGEIYKNRIEIPCIFMSGNYCTLKNQNLISFDVVDILSKPLKPSSLSLHIENLLDFINDQNHRA